MVANSSKAKVIRRRVLQNVATNYLAKIITLGAGFLLTPFILAKLGPLDYGLWVLIGSVMSYGSLLDLGIGGAVIKYVAEYSARGETEKASRVIATALVFYGGLGLIPLGLSTVFAWLTPKIFALSPERQDNILLLILVIGANLAVSLPCTTPNAVLRGLQRFDLVNLLNISGTAISLILTVVILLLGGGLLGIVLLNLPLTLLMQLPTLWLIRRTAPNLRFSWRNARRAEARTVISFGSAIFLTQAAGLLQNKTDEIVIGLFLKLELVTAYSLAHRLSEIAQILTDQFMKVILPLASELHAAEDKARLRYLYLTSTRLTLAIFLPIGFLLITLAPSLLSLWVGAEYAQYDYLVILLTFASLIVTSQWPAGSILQGMARHWFMAGSSLAAGLLNLVLSITLAQPLGLAGVALGTLIPTVLECGLLVLPYALRVIKISFGQWLKQVLWPALLPVFPMGLVFFGLTQLLDTTALLPLILLATLASLTYLVSYLSIKTNRLERELCLNLIHIPLHFVQIRFKRP